MGARQSCSKACSNCTADCTRPAHGYGDDFDDERPGGDPAGATFEETLEDLNSLDRHLMLFCATSNLSAVRWLLHLGAHWDTSDANATTCLHVACRAGALAIVKEMMQYQPLLQATDMAGWTALHIAVLMGRREVVVRLLQAGAPPHQRNNKGQMPAELCADNGTFEALRSFDLHNQQSPGKPWHFCKDTGPGEDIIGSRLQYEPFFVPRQPVLRSQQYKKEFQKIGTLMFNQQPGYGLAFLVASGVARDYPVDMSTFLRRSKVDIKQVGSFLGEAFSLSHTIRLEFINSVVLQNTGVVSALARVFHMLQLPDDLQKINRLVHGVARIWWRQHERMLKDMNGQVPQSRPSPASEKEKGFQGQNAAVEELVGLELKQYLTSSDVLHQLMFSSVLLHWYIHKDGSGQKREMDFAVWKKLNQGIEAGSTDVPEHVQLRVHSIISRSFILELAVATANGRNRGDAAGGGPDEGGGYGPGDDWAASVATERPRSPVLSPSAAIEGWAQIVGGGFPRPSGLTGVQTVTYRHMSNIFSEVTNSSGMLKSPLGFQQGEGPHGAAVAAGVGGKPGLPSEGVVPGPRRDDYSWLSICYTLLFFSASPTTGAPYAFVELQRVQIASIQTDTRILSLVGAPEPDDADADLAAAGGGSSNNAAATADKSGELSGRDTPTGAGTPGGKPHAPVIIVLLLPDGRWQELSLAKLDLRLSSNSELETWSNHLTAASQGKVVRPPTTKASASPRRA